MSGKRGTVEERLWRHCIPEPNSGCWLWLASIHPKTGYAQIMMPHGKPERAHRVSYKIHKGPIPAGLDVRHTCDIRCCINPNHLITGTRKQNMADAIKRGRLQRGTDRYNAKLDEVKVTAIRTDQRVQQIIAFEYGVDQALISRIKAGKLWK
jgi:hypothetical protein